jgi:hypothetical protein
MEIYPLIFHVHFLCIKFNALNKILIYEIFNLFIQYKYVYK